GLASLARKSKEDMDFRAVGRMALLTLVARDETGDEEPALSADDVESLSAEEAQRLSEGIAKACGASLPSTADGPLIALGSVLYEQACQQQRRMAELIESAKSPLGKAFDAVPATVRAQLADQFRRIEELSLGLQASR